MRGDEPGVLDETPTPWRHPFAQTGRSGAGGFDLGVRVLRPATTPRRRASAVRVFGSTSGAPPRTRRSAPPPSRAPAVACIAAEGTDRYAAPSGTTTTGGGSPARGKRRERLAAARCVREVAKEAAASRLGSRRKMARMRMATTQRANRELHNRTNQCRCHEPARGHFWDSVTLRCTNGPCTRTWEGQQLNPTDCEYRRRAPWDSTSDASSTVSVRDVGPCERRRVRGGV